MATKKTAAEAETAGVVLAAPVDPWKDMVTIRLEKAAPGESKYQFVAVNGHAFQIEKNKEVSVPRPIADAITDMFDAQGEADDYNEENAARK